MLLHQCVGGEVADDDVCRSFSSGEPVDSIETEKSRIVLHELEEGWWILAVRPSNDVILPVRS